MKKATLLKSSQADVQKDDGTSVKDVHKGSLFIATPDGCAYVYELEGTSNAPSVDKVIEVKLNLR